MRRRRVVVQLVQVRLVSIGDLEDPTVGRDAVDAHAGDCDDQVLVAIELHAERPAADMGEHLAGFEIRPGEADHVAVAGRAVEPALAVEDDILGALDPVDADRLCVDQAVVLRVGRR